MDESHSVYKVCYQSVDIELPPFDMVLVVSNDSKKWVSMSSRDGFRRGGGGGGPGGAPPPPPWKPSVSIN